MARVNVKLQKDWFTPHGVLMEKDSVIQVDQKDVTAHMEVLGNSRAAREARGEILPQEKVLAEQNAAAGHPTPLDVVGKGAASQAAAIAEHEKREALILSAFESMNVENDAQWTADGEPKMAFLEQITGLNITRAELEQGEKEGLWTVPKR